MISRVLLVKKFIVTGMMQIICIDNLNSKAHVCMCTYVHIEKQEEKTPLLHSTRILLKSGGELPWWRYVHPALSSVEIFFLASHFHLYFQNSKLIFKRSHYFLTESERLCMCKKE